MPEIPMLPGNRDPERRARKLVLAMAASLVLLIGGCSAAWWWAGHPSFDRLGQIISAAGIAWLLAGVGLFAFNFRAASRLRPVRRPVRSALNTHLVLYFWGTGLLCLFAGGLIILGL